MRIELAPMEGITSYIYRNAVNKYYGGVDTYYTPFISTHKDKTLNFKEKKELNPDNNVGINLIPQVLTSNADEFIFTATQIKEFGYDHININFGCPSGTVTTKKKGAGALLDVLSLEGLLSDIFSKTDMRISIKTRMGYEDPSEWESLIKVFEKFPIEELIVHARVREDFYNGRARSIALAEYAFPEEIKFSYNGDIYFKNDIKIVQNLFPYMDAAMIGRGFISRPWLAREIANDDSMLDVNSEKGLCVFKEFNHALIDGYNEIMPGEKNTLFKLKELWVYMIKSFEITELTQSVRNIYLPDFKLLPNTPKAKKLLKSIRKCNSLKEYEHIIDSIPVFN